MNIKYAMIINIKYATIIFYIIEIPLLRLYACRKFFQSLLVLSDSSDRVSSMLENSDFVLGQEPVHFKNKLKYKQKFS